MAVPAADNLNTGSHIDVNLGATFKQVGSGAKTVFSVVVDNSGNSAASYVKFYNSASPTVGTTRPNGVIRVKAGMVRRMAFNGGAGTPFGTALTMACVTAAGTAGATAPTTAVKVRVNTN